MATAQLEIKNWLIECYDDRYHKSLSEDKTEYNGNGWSVKILDNQIVAECEREYSDGINKIRAVVKRNWIETTISINGKNISHKTRRCDYDGTGTLGLAGGNVMDRYVYFRNPTFNEFLDEFFITAKMPMVPSPNGTFKTILRFSDGVRNKLFTDGTVKVVNIWWELYTCEISNASAVFIESRVDGHGIDRILYTNLSGIAAMRSAMKKLKYIEVCTMTEGQTRKG